jgi:hypothetical protein
MKAIWKRRALAIIGGLAALVVTSGILFINSWTRPIAFGFFYLGGLLDQAIEKLIPPGKPGTNMNTGEQAELAIFAPLALSIALSLWLVLAFWERRPSPKARRISYWILLAGLTSFSFVNFTVFADSLINIWAQVIIDLVQSTVGIILVFGLVKEAPKTVEMTVVKSLAIFFISLFAVLVPISCAVVFLLLKMRIIELDTGRSPLFQAWMPGIAALASLAVSVVNFGGSYKKLREEQANESRTVIVRP